MKYDRKKHITTQQLADLLGIAAVHVPGTVSIEGAPRGLGRTVVEGKRQQLYLRSEVVEWLATKTEPAEVKEAPQRYKGETVPPATPRPLHKQGTYKPSAQMSINQQRAAELYPHRLITPAGVGNGIDHGQNKRRFAI